MKARDERHFVSAVQVPLAAPRMLDRVVKGTVASAVPIAFGVVYSARAVEASAAVVRLSPRLSPTSRRYPRQCHSGRMSCHSDFGLATYQARVTSVARRLPWDRVVAQTGLGQGAIGRAGGRRGRAIAVEEAAAADPYAGVARYTEKTAEVKAFAK